MARLHPAHRLRLLANAINLTTAVGLVIALAGRSRLSPGPDGLILAEGYRLPFPRAGAFTVGNVIVTATSMAELERRTAGVLGHEGRHAWQYALTGVWFFPAYALASAWSAVRTRSPARGNLFERHAGLVSGGYVPAGGKADRRRPQP
ncbi:MAG: hypothetical protein ACK5LS_04990 [Propioniciclava sp.]